MFLVAFVATYVTLASFEENIPLPSPPEADKVAGLICESVSDAEDAGIYDVDHNGDFTVPEMESEFSGRCWYRAVAIKPPGVVLTDVFHHGDHQLLLFRIFTRSGDRWMYQITLPPSQSLTR
jgi:hypothetical protein